MKKQTYFVRLAGGYFYKEKSTTITFTVEKSPFTIKASQVVFWAPTQKQGEAEFLIEISEEELKNLRALTKINFDVRGRYGTGNLPPRPGVPPPVIEFLLW